MTMHKPITAAVEQVPYGDLYVSDLNPRTVINPQGIEALAENIRELGLIQNLAGLRDETGKVGVVAGGRRLRALALLQDDPRFASVPVKIAPDQETAQMWASSENHQREQQHPADEIRDYGNMAARGVSVAAIAIAFGVTEPHVYRRLKLAGLPDPVLDALKVGEITLQNAAAFTVSEDEANSLAVLEKVRGEGYSDHQIKQMLKPDSVRDTDRRVIFVGREDYEANGGHVTSDLFADQTFIDDVALLNDLFRCKLAVTCDAITAKGWKWAEALDSTYLPYGEFEQRKLDRIFPDEGTLTDEQSARYDELAELANGDILDEAGEAELAELQAVLEGTYSAEQKAVAGVIFYVNQTGELQTHEGLVRKEDKAAAIEAGFLRKSSQSGGEAAPKSPISQKLSDDLSRIAQGARQHAAMRNPDLLLDLLAYQLSHELRSSGPLGFSKTDVPNWPSTEAAGYALDERLTSNPPRDMWDAKDLGASFRAFRKKGPEHVRGELVRFLAAQYRGGDEKLSALIDKETQPNIREVWTPNAENFFSRVGGPYLNDLWRDLLDLSEDHPTATSFAKLKKGEKAGKLEALFSGDPDLRNALGVTEAQAAKIDAWLPEGME
ncbi:ParB N-terminal domain-containing protein [Leisingera sp. HS039]|uniref:ParB/RepB/Spo0J family partition protein n=1 Tax=Leisingera sp. HS039 TaxID=2818496 RepID=UPI001B39CEDB|nr:ParB/RepB/Spo0J family partition protein [Leisingera sp. HS039]MBQ4827578.1 ParB N-terminal domain-containing protein [Leisingera sp. HS039]